MRIRPPRPSATLGALLLATAALRPPAAQAQQLYDFGTAFGRAAAVAGSDILVAEPQNVVRPGRVYVFRAGDGAWPRTAVLTASDGERSDHFGRAIAAVSDAVVVGAPRARAGSGGAYLFRRSDDTWSEVAALLPPQGVGALGSAVAVSEAWIAATERAGERERVRVWARVPSGPAGDGTVLEGTDEDRRFGAALAAAADGGLLVCGADGAGAVFVDLFHPDDDGSWRRVARSDVGVPLSPDGGLLSQDPYKECGLSADGDMVAVGIPQADGGRGRVELFTVGADGLAPAAALAAPDGAANGFGTSVALAGGTVWAGAPGTGGLLGAAARFERAGSGWGPGEVLRGPGTDFMPVFGLALAAGADLAVIGAPGDAYGAGVAVAYRRATGGWTSQDLAGETETYEAITDGRIECSDGQAAIFGCQEVDVVSLLPVQEMGAARGAMVNDVWGWTDPETGREYALVGRSDGTSFVDVTEPERPVYLGQLPKTEGSRGQAWRDVKVLRDHALVVADNAGQHGMQIFDLKRLRDVDPADPPTFEVDALYTDIASAHNLGVNEETGYAYIVGHSGGGRGCASIHMVDLRDPLEPTFAGCYNDPSVGLGAAGQTHDVQCVLYRGPDEPFQGREICFAYAETAISIGDVTDKENPIVLSQASMPGTAYIHQGWLEESQRYIYVNDELDELNGLTDRTRTMIWDVTELEDPVLAGEYLGETGATDHNLYIHGDLMYQSNYAAGLRIIDISDPENPREVAHFDTAPFADDVPGFFDGSWSNYPFFESGNVLVTSHKQGLFIVRRRVPVS